MLKRIFSASKLVKDLDLSGKWDDSFFTPQERAEHFKSLLSSYQPFKLAQRIIAILLVSTFLFIHLVNTLGIFILILIDENYKELLSVYQYNNEALLYPVLLIAGFYFAGGTLESGKNLFNKRKNATEKK